ncbi:MAG: phosphatase PAP2 family protein [Candidatus Aenigmarchaeota archaeon]|nr:phosphatase PAP2 family protein [Candidatus Aenigmarchaeota archaeon]
MYVIKKFFNEYVRDVTSLGGLPVYGLVCLYALASGQYHLFIQLLTMVIAIMIVTYVTKSVYFKARPDNTAKKKGANLLEKADLSSFPSVHAARITALGILFALIYANPLITVLAAVVVVAVCVSRILIKRHYTADVIAGFILGLIVGYAAFLWV